MHLSRRGRNAGVRAGPGRASLGETLPELSILHRRWSTVLALVLAAAAATCTTGAADDAPVGAILFVGNSLTYVNDLPGVVRRVAEAAGGELRVEMAAGPDLAVIDHANGATDALAKISRSRWDAVVLQQGPTPAGICRDTLVIAAMRFAPAIREAGGRPAIFLSWTRQSYTGPIDEVAASATAAARAVGGVVVPIGVAWRKALRADPTLPLYGGDGYHPGPAGTLLAALTAYDRIVGHDVSSIAPESLAPIVSGLTPAQLHTLTTAAHAASRERPDDPDRAEPADTTRLSPGGGPC
ncbi:MAG TPA: hypothetical protein VJQ44_15890 [Gemmatimonadales bacterium]|nr:hypothetical protein [Gemmatimonadales bacterium]